MSKKSFIQKYALGLSILGVCVTGAIAQKPTETPTQDINTKARKVGKEVSEVYKKWLNNDVPYIITNEEKKAFLKLTTDDERENFIESFWRRRDPDPDTEENEFREEYYERIAYANEHYASGIPGWKTDRGRIYVTFGKPDEIESHPSGGSYDRQSYEGGGSTTTYPFETWFYRHLDNVGEGIEIEFVDPTGSGEYRIARDANEKDALANVPGAGLTLNEQYGLSSKGDRLSGVNNSNNNYLREQDTPFRRLEIISNLQRPPQVKFSDLQASLTDSPIVDNNPLDFDMRVDFFRQSDDRVIAAFTIQTDNKELSFGDAIGGLQSAKMNIFGRITAVSGKRSGIFEDSVTTSAADGELAQARDRKSIYQKTYALQPGTYKVDVVVRDVNSGNKGIVSKGFTVPKYDEKKLSASTMILASKLRETTEGDIGGMFVIGNAKVIPNLSGNYKKGQEVGVYLQVYNAQIDQTTLRPAVDVEYILMKDGKEAMAPQKEDWSGLSDAGQRLTLARLLATDRLSTGNYELKVKIKDQTTGQLIEQSEKFTLTQ